MKTRLAVIILNYKTPQLVIDCLASIQGEIDNGINVFIVDNNSDDGSCEKIQECIIRNKWEDWCRLIPSEVNGGFAAGNNLGIRAVNAEAYMLLNSDTIIRPGAFSSLLKALKLNPHAGLIAPALENEDGFIDHNTFRFITPVWEFIRAARTRQITSLLRNFDIVMNQTNSNSFEPQWVGFACVVIRREVIGQIGLLDENFFMYFEDIDYCKRVLKKGWKILYWPDARVVHLLGGSSGVTKASNLRKRPPKYYYEARAKYFKKHYGIHGFITANILWTIGRLISFFREIFGNKVPAHREYESIDIWTGLMA